MDHRPRPAQPAPPKHMHRVHRVRARGARGCRLPPLRPLLVRLPAVRLCEARGGGQGVPPPPRRDAHKVHGRHTQPARGGAAARKRAERHPRPRPRRLPLLHRRPRLCRRFGARAALGKRRGSVGRRADHVRALHRRRLQLWGERGGGAAACLQLRGGDHRAGAVPVPGLLLQRRGGGVARVPARPLPRPEERALRAASPARGGRGAAPRAGGGAGGAALRRPPPARHPSPPTGSRPDTSAVRPRRTRPHRPPAARLPPQLASLVRHPRDGGVAARPPPLLARDERVQPRRGQGAGGEELRRARRGGLADAARGGALSGGGELERALARVFEPARRRPAPGAKQPVH
mmetsp:Transcript_17913/g.57675  ORF Transcript_17913/g.57675 Transcript_17913/m.57675 type:complete len:347 (-) Transcript_17913:44-1084(-)